MVNVHEQDAEHFLHYHFTINLSMLKGGKPSLTFVMDGFHFILSLYLAPQQCAHNSAYIVLSHGSSISIYQLSTTWLAARCARICALD